MTKAELEATIGVLRREIADLRSDNDLLQEAIDAAEAEVARAEAKVGDEIYVRWEPFDEVDSRLAEEARQDPRYGQGRPLADVMADLNASDSANPKDALGVLKAPLDLVPPALIIAAAAAMQHGAEKYGPYNWREKDVRASVYFAAQMRHLLAWWDSEDDAPDSGAPHLGHVAACAAILLDAEHGGHLIDDRPRPGPGPAMLSFYDKSKDVPC